MTTNLEAKVTTVDPLKGKYKVEGPKRKKYELQFESARYFDHLNLEKNGSMIGSIHVSDDLGRIVLYNRKGEGKTIAHFICIDGSYRVSEEERFVYDSDNEIHPLDYLLREIATRAKK